jgi:hypothetical protein
MEISEGTQQNYILTPEAAAEPVFADPNLMILEHLHTVVV